MTENDDYPLYTVTVKRIGDQPGLVFTLLRQALGTTPAETESLMVTPGGIVVAHGARMLVEPVFRRFKAVGATPSDRSPRQ
jgi:hypothetical protein